MASSPRVTANGLSMLLIFLIALLTTVEAFVPPGRSKRTASWSSISMVEGQMAATYDSLATRLIDRYEKDYTELKNNQLFVCVAGGPGSGKSTLATAVAERINEQMQNDDGDGGESSSVAVVLPMDGFHYSRSQLQSMGESPDIEYTYEQLMARRGAPWTFDAEGCIAAFTAAREEGKASLPVYSRVKSDPVPDGVQLNPDTKIVLLEGNYLLAWGDERWEPLRANKVFDETWYIACKSLEEQRERLVKRHLETWSDEKTKLFGEGAKGAGAKADSNDMKNLIWVEEMSREYADLVVVSV